MKARFESSSHVSVSSVESTQGHLGVNLGSTCTALPRLAPWISSQTAQPSSRVDEMENERVDERETNNGLAVSKGCDFQL